MRRRWGGNQEETRMVRRLDAGCDLGKVATEVSAGPVGESPSQARERSTVPSLPPSSGEELDSRCEDLYQAALWLLQLRDERPLRLDVVERREERLRAATAQLRAYLADVRTRAERRANR